MVAAVPRACACGARSGTPRPAGHMATGLDCVCHADRAHLYARRYSDFDRLAGGFGLILVFILSSSGE